MEKAINSAIQFVFYYRLVFVLLALGLIGYGGTLVYQSSPPADQLRNSILIITGGAVVIGIFYSVLNYEHSQLTFRHHIKLSRETLTFNTTGKMHEPATIGHFKILKEFYEAHQQDFRQAAYQKVQASLKQDTEARIAFIVLFNYFESIALGVLQGIMDEDFMKAFFKTVFTEQFQLFEGFLEYLRTDTRSERLFWRFSQLAKKWKTE